MIESLRDRIARWRTYNRIRTELSRHNHRELYDLRISSGDIDRIAREGAYGHAAERGAIDEHFRWRGRGNLASR